MVSYSDKSSPNLEESILNTNTLVVDRKDMTQSLNLGQILLWERDQTKVFEGKVETVSRYG